MSAPTVRPTTSYRTSSSWLIGITCVLILWGAGVFEKRESV